MMAASLGAAGMFAPARERQPDPEPAVDPKMSHFMDCAKACDDCTRACDLCAGHCAKVIVDGRKEHLETLRMCQACATICSATSRVVAKFGPCSDLMLVACVDACKRCGDACTKHPDDAIMKKCADECRRCEKACREMIKHAKSVVPEKPEKNDKQDK